MFKYIHNKKGLSLVELLVTLAVLSLVIPLAGQLLYQHTNLFNVAQTKWEIQNAVKLACSKFEANKDALVNSYQTDILYDPVIEEGIVLKDDGTFRWKHSRGNSYVITEEGFADKNDLYTYIFSTPTYNEEGKYLGTYLFIREYGSSRSKLFLDSEGFGDVPVEICFTIAESVDALNSQGEKDNTIANTYLTNAINIELKSGVPDIAAYSLKTTYSFVNISEGKRVNYAGSALVFEKEWLDTVGVAAYPTGWVNEELNKDINSGYPNNTIARYYDADKQVREANITNVNKTANVIRFVSPTAFNSKGETDDHTTDANMASCLTTFAFCDNTKLSSHVLGALRDFRDNILKGTEFGDWFIYNYYNTWSPFLVKNLGFLKPVYRVILTPVAYVCGMIANI